MVRVLQAPELRQILKRAIILRPLARQIRHRFEPGEFGLDTRLFGGWGQFRIIERADGDLEDRIAIFLHMERRAAGSAEAARDDRR